MNTSNPILIIGSTGKVGRRLIAKLTAAGIGTRGVSRSTAPAFIWEDAKSWPAPFECVRAAFISYAPDLAETGAPERIAALIDVAITAGVERVVLLSGRGERNAILSEDIVRNSGLAWTIVRASWFNQNFSEGHLLSSVLGGAIALPAGNVVEPFIDVEDIADVAYAALTDAAHEAQLYEVTGPQLLSFEEVANVISEASGCKVGYVPITPEELYEAILTEAGEHYATVLRDLCVEVLDGRNQSLSDGVQRALGRAPRSFADFVRAAAATGVWSVNNAA